MYAFCSYKTYGTAMQSVQSVHGALHSTGKECVHAGSVYLGRTVWMRGGQGARQVREA